MHSIFMRRVVAAFLAIFIITFLVVSGGYFYLTRTAYSDIKLEEMLPKARAMLQITEEYRTGALSYGGFLRVANRYMEAMDGAALVADADGTPVYINAAALRADDGEIEESLKTPVASILAGGPEQAYYTVENGRHLLIAGVPIVAPETGEVTGCVVIVKSAEEIWATARRFTRMLIFTLLIALPLVALLAVFTIRRLTNPVRRVGEVAIEMSKGNFRIRADETAPGEVGLLSRALNNLCETLTQTIYQLRAEKGQLDQILKSLKDGIVALDAAGNLMHINPALMALFGAVRPATRMELIADAQLWDVFDEVLRTGEPQSLQYAAPRDRTLWVNVSRINVEGDAPAGVVGMFTDMTEVERLERMRQDYVANVSHELRTPLTAIRGLLEPLSDGMVKDENDVKRYYDIMLREVLRLSRLITDMLEITRLQSGSGYVELAETDVNAILEDMVDSYENEAREKGITLKLDCPALPAAFTAEDRVAQVLVILLDNAMRYTPAGGTITIAASDGPRINVSVADTGCGIPENDIPHIFERFYKVDKSRNEGGTGLGLSIAKYIIDMLGETILVESELGRGTCFTFTLKKYEKNAIALGPPAPWDEPPPTLDVDVPKDLRDARYEVLPPPEKHQKRKKR